MSSDPINYDDKKKDIKYIILFTYIFLVTIFIIVIIHYH